MSAVRVIGVHPVHASEPVHLIEVEFAEIDDEIDWMSFTQPLDGQDRSYWQVPYDERPVPGTSNRWCFFFHYLDRSRGMDSFTGTLPLPPETPIPNHLRFMAYEAP
jgi:hypothetical protein